MTTKSKKITLLNGIIELDKGESPTAANLVPGAFFSTQRSHTELYLREVRRDGRCYLNMTEGQYLRAEDAAELADFFATLSAAMKPAPAEKQMAVPLYDR